ncbi:MAG TPA: ABC transporter permease [Micromonosporaceae bacterium]|nr:ABC transporter permease [Micromonosporaceae bacterium]
MTGTGALARLILRRDRVLLPLWVFLIGLLPVFVASSTGSLYPTDEARAGYIRDALSNTLFLVLYGRPTEPGLGALTSWRASTSMAILALISMFTVIRHTRVEEEAGRRDLVESTVVGRYAGLLAALLVTCGANVVLGGVVTLTMLGQDPSTEGALAIGAAWAAVGCLFAVVGAVTAQLSQSPAAARGIGGAVLAVAFVVRAIGNVNSETGGAAWLSPLGWIDQIHPYSDNRWWVLGLVAGFGALLAWLAFALAARRDVGAGIVAPRLGPAQAAPGLRSPLALAWRLHRGALLGWLASFAFFGVLVGGFAETAGKMLGENPALKEYMERVGGTSAFSDIVIVGLFSVGALGLSGLAISAALRLRTEEASLRSEPVLATGASRLRWAGSHLAFAVLGPAVAMMLAGTIGGLVHGADTGHVARELPRVLAGALVQLPAVWLLGALTVAMFGLLPRYAAIGGWLALSFCFFLGQLGALLQLPQSIMDISPFTHVPRVPGGELAWTPLIVLTVVAAAFVAVGLAAFRRRDVPVT